MSAAPSAAAAAPPAKSSVGDETMKAARFIRTNLPLKEAKLLMQQSSGQWTQKRTEYFKGDKLIKFLTTPQGKKPPLCQSEVEAMSLGTALLRKRFQGAPLLHRAEIHDKKKRLLKAVMTSKEFSADGFYCWIYQGSQIKRNLMLGAVIFGFTACCMFPIWPDMLKVVVWYISVTLLIVLLTLIVIRLVLFCCLWAIGIDFWLLPNLFADDLGVVESFIPFYTYEKADGGYWESTKWFRLGMGVAIIACCIWIYNQPTEFDDFVEANNEFLRDLYDGNLLADVSQEQKENIDRVVPNLEDLENMDLGDDDDVESGGDGTGTATYQHDVDEEEESNAEVEDMMARLLEEEDEDLGEDAYDVEDEDDEA